ncbi:MAG: tellurium resistance protein TerC [Phycisphaerales bacterium]|nr:tellurium resistance protein TerC [Phycisphaerales bacterium]
MRKAFIFVVGGTVLLIGVALLVLPGPAFIVIPAGLAILAIEFAWARRWLDKLKGWVETAAARAKAKLRGSRG